MNKLMAVLESILALMLIIGLWTQVAALVAVVCFVVMIIQKIRTKSFMTNGVNYTLILLILAWPRRRVIEPDEYESWRFV